jgi:hypothetical protein
MPLAPASAGLRLAMLSYGFVEVTGHPIDIAAITAFTFGVSAVMATSGLMVAAVILAQEFGTLSPRRALATVRGTARPALGAGWDVHDVDAQAGAVVRSRGGLRRLHPGRLLRVRPLRRPHPAAVVQHEPVP